MGGGGNRTGGVNLGRSNQQTLTVSDATAIKEKVSLANNVSPEIRSRAQVIAEGNNTNTQINGVLAAYQPAHSVDLEEGDFISDDQVRSGGRVAVLGNS
jgi:putative ABC transport system permease protein